MVVAPLVHLDDHDVDVELTIELSNPYLDVELGVDNVVQLVVVLLDVDVEIIVLNYCDPLLLLHLGDVPSGCCTPLIRKNLLKAADGAKDFSC